jgi:hypothetical protein
MIPVAAEAIKNIKNVVDDELFLRLIQKTNAIKVCSLISLYIFFITACSDSDINIPEKHSIGFNSTLVAIYSPSNGTTLTADQPFILDYEILRAIKTSYVKIQVDKNTPITVENIKGKHHINGLSKGMHTIVVSEYRSDNKPSGSQAIVKVLMK